MPYTYVFFGSDEFSIIVLEQLLESGFIPTLCVTQPDKPKGRKLILTPTPLKEFCIGKNIPCITPEPLTARDLNFEIEKLTPATPDFFVVASYGKIISQKVLDIPTNGSLNVHPSLLPLYRGASPIETAIVNDSKETGVTIMLMDAQMDHGPIVKQISHTFPSWPESKKEVHDTLAVLGGKTLAEIIEPFLKKEITPLNQDHTQATFTRMIQKSDGEIQLTDTDYSTYLKYLAYTPWPGIFFFIEKQNKQIRVKIESAHFDSQEGFVIDTVIPEGKNSMDFESFRNGYLNKN